MNTIIKENDRGEIIYKKNLDGSEIWYDNGICVRFLYPNGYDVKYTIDKNTRTVIRVEDNEGFVEDFSANRLYSQ